MRVDATYDDEAGFSVRFDRYWEGHIVPPVQVFEKEMSLFGDSYFPCRVNDGKSEFESR